jgi:hypothetical protein
MMIATMIFAGTGWAAIHYQPTMPGVDAPGKQGLPITGLELGKSTHARFAGENIHETYASYNSEMLSYNAEMLFVDK